MCGKAKEVFSRIDHKFDLMYSRLGAEVSCVLNLSRSPGLGVKIRRL